MLIYRGYLVFVSEVGVGLNELTKSYCSCDCCIWRLKTYGWSNINFYTALVFISEEGLDLNKLKKSHGACDSWI